MNSFDYRIIFVSPTRGDISIIYLGETSFLVTLTDAESMIIRNKQLVTVVFECEWDVRFLEVVWKLHIRFQDRFKFESILRTYCKVQIPPCLAKFYNYYGYKPESILDKSNSVNTVIFYSPDFQYNIICSSYRLDKLNNFNPDYLKMSNVLHISFSNILINGTTARNFLNSTVLSLGPDPPLEMIRNSIDHFDKSITPGLFASIEEIKKAAGITMDLTLFQKCFIVMLMFKTNNQPYTRNLSTDLIICASVDPDSLLNGFDFDLGKDGFLEGTVIDLFHLPVLTLIKKNYINNVGYIVEGEKRFTTFTMLGIRYKVPGLATDPDFNDNLIRTFYKTS